MESMKTALIFPTYNATATLGLLLDSIRQQFLQPDHILAIDSSSSDDTIEILKKYNIEYRIIEAFDFDHGTTRKYATSLIDADIYIFVTQDVSFVDKYALKNLLHAFVDTRVGCAYGRQLPNKNADILAAHSRLFAYPETNSIKSYEDRKRLGIQTCFNSDNFSAYRKEALLDIGGLPENIIFAEDMCAAAKMLIKGWKVAYQADALIYHSHNYAFGQEFKRYFDTGVFHTMNPWVLGIFPAYFKDLVKYIRSVFSCCLKQRQCLVLSKAAGILFTRYFGFLVGRHYKSIPLFIRKKLSMNSNFWR